MHTVTTAGRPVRAAGTVPLATTVVTIAVVGVIVVGQLYVTIPLIAPLTVAWHTSPAGATWATTAFAVAYAIGSLACGPLSVRFGRRHVMVVAILLTAGCTALVPVGSSLASGSALRALQGLAAGAFLPAAYSYLSARITPRRLPLALTAVSCAMGGTVIFGQVEGQLLDAALGWQSVFLVSAPLLVLGAALVWKVVRPDSETDPPRASAHRQPRTTRRPARLVPLYLVTLVVAGTLTGSYTGVQLYGPAELAGDPTAMLALRSSALPALVAAVLLAPLLGAITARRRAAGGFVVAAAGMLGVALFGSDAVGLGAALFLFVFGISAVGPALVQEVGAEAGAGQPVAIAWYGFMLNVGGGIGAQLPTLLPDLTVLAWTLVTIIGIAVAITVLSAPVYRLSSAPDRPHSSDLQT